MYGMILILVQIERARESEQISHKALALKLAPQQWLNEREFMRSLTTHTKDVIKMVPDASMLSALHRRIGLASLLSNHFNKM